MLAIVVAVHITTRAPQIDLNRLMVAFLSVGLVSAAEAWAAAFARLRRLTGFGCPRGMWFRANGRTPSGAEIRRSALGALCTFGIFYVCGTRCRVTATDQRWRGTSPEADRLTGAEEMRDLGSQSVRGKSSSAWTGSETTFGVPHGVGTSIMRDAQTMLLWVNTLLTTAATRPAQSTTGAPEAP